MDLSDHSSLPTCHWPILPLTSRKYPIIHHVHVQFALSSLWWDGLDAVNLATASSGRDLSRQVSPRISLVVVFALLDLPCFPAAAAAARGSVTLSPCRRCEDILGGRGHGRIMALAKSPSLSSSVPRLPSFPAPPLHAGSISSLVLVSRAPFLK